jgi:hypothetical protein
MFELFDLVRDAAKKKASDIFLKRDSPPCWRLHGHITRCEGYPVLSGEDVRNLAYSVMSHEQIGRFEHRHELDMALEIEGVTRLRINFYQQRGAMAMVCRLVPLKIYTLEQLGLPPVLADLTKSRQGLILVTAGKYHHRRGPDRVRPPGQGRYRFSARRRSRHRLVFGRTEVHDASEPRCPPRRRASRYRDDVRRPDGGGNRTPCLFDAPHFVVRRYLGAYRQHVSAC